MLLIKVVDDDAVTLASQEEAEVARTLAEAFESAKEVQDMCTCSTCREARRWPN